MSINATDELTKGQRFISINKFEAYGRIAWTNFSVGTPFKFTFNEDVNVTVENPCSKFEGLVQINPDDYDEIEERVLPKSTLKKVNYDGFTVHVTKDDLDKYFERND